MMSLASAYKSQPAGRALLERYWRALSAGRNIVLIYSVGRELAVLFSHGSIFKPHNRQAAF